MDATKAQGPARNKTVGQPRVRVRLRRYVRTALLCTMPFAAMIAFRFFGEEPPNQAWVSSGPAKLVRINDDASLTIGQSISEKVNGTAEVHWMGIDIASSEETKRWLEGRLQDVETLTLRLDRRRLDESGRLRAYFFLEDKLLNAELVEQGFATDATHPADFAAIARVIRKADSNRGFEQ